MMNDRNMIAIAELESETHFPNLLNDRDFVMYSWTLPFAEM